MSTGLHQREALDTPDDVLVLDGEIRTIGAYERVVKTTVDRVGAAGLLVLLMPVLLVVALGVRAAVGRGCCIARHESAATATTSRC